MEDGRTTLPAGKVGRRDRRARATTVSGAIPDVQKEASDRKMRLPWSSPSAPESPAIPVNSTASSSAMAAPVISAPRPPTHRRTISGNILSRFHFLRPNSGDDGRSTFRETKTALQPTSPTKSLFSRKSVEEDNPPDPPKTEHHTTVKEVFSRKSVDDDVPLTSPTSPDAEQERESSLRAAMKQVKGRKRKGSLRKTALLGGRRNISEGKDGKVGFSLLQRPPIMKPVSEPVPEQEQESLNGVPGSMYDKEAVGNEAQPRPTDSPSLGARRGFSYENALASSSESSLSEPPAASTARLSLLTDHQGQVSRVPRTMVNDLGSPMDIKSPASAASYTSTTSDDDMLTFNRPTINKIYIPPSRDENIPTPLSTSSGSYFPEFAQPQTQHQISLRRASQKRSPLSRSLSAYPDAHTHLLHPTPHSNTETEYWGWVILFVTWVTFTVGMGSCLEIWSWAWDVGETPRAPPELEDDSTLPIVGYYPALIVLTGGVVSWVWITVAWVGMKYFRHAKIEV